jgi:uncharacterized membrane protein YdbT with pleckstrin-like domain
MPMQNPFEIVLENQSEDEDIKRIWRHHPVTLIAPVARVLAFALIPIALLLISGLAMFTSVWLFVIFVIILAITATYAAYEWVSWYNDVFVLTNYRVVDVQQDGFFSRKFSEASLSNIQDVSHEVHGVMQTFFNYGNVLVQTAGAETKINMHDVGEPQQQAVFILKEQQKHVAEQDTSLSAEDLIRLLAKHKEDLDEIAKTDKESKVQEVDEQLKKARGEKAKKKVDTDKSEEII